jgi:hypothetical protein
LREETEEDEFVVEWKGAPDYRKEEACGDGNEAKEEGDDDGVLIMYEVVPQLGAAVGDAAIGEFEVESAERGGDVDYEEAVEEAYGCFPMCC